VGERLLSSFGHQVIVANARQVKLISASSRKDDRLDAQTLARLARVDAELLPHPASQREGARGPDASAGACGAGGYTHQFGEHGAGPGQGDGGTIAQVRCGSMGVEKVQRLPAVLVEALTPLLETVEGLTQQIKASDQKLEQLARREYPETELLRQVSGVGSLISLTFVLTVEDPNRFRKSRDVGCYVGSVRGAVNRASAGRGWESARKATYIYGSCWCRERTAF
jgi:transposase